MSGHDVADVLGEAFRFQGVVENPLNSNRGVEVDYFVREAGLDPKGHFPWCAAFVGQMGRQALGHRWPLPRTASVAALAAFGATNEHVLFDTPAVGDVFLLWEADLNRFGHTGFVVSAPDASGRCETIEGNTSPITGSREGFGVFARHRTFSPRDRFLRWEVIAA